jgi:hypothetical protein
MNLDFTPLRRKIPYKELFGYFKELPRSKRMALIVAATLDVLLVIIGIIALPWTFASIGSGSVDSFQANFVWVIVGVAALLAPFVYLYSQQEAIRIKRFAQANNLTYYQGPLVGDNKGLIFQYGHSKSFEYVFGLQNNSIKEFGAYSYVTGSGKSSQTHYYSYVLVKLPRKLPNMVLDSRENNMFGQTGLPKTLSKDQVLELEGDFNNYFTLYAPKQYEQDALYIFTPDVMQAMVDAPNRYDGEIVDDEFYLYTKRLSIHDTDDIEELLSIASRITSQLDKQAANYRDERVENSNGDAIAAHGARLKALMVPQAIVVVMAVLITYWIVSLLYR